MKYYLFVCVVFLALTAAFAISVDFTPHRVPGFGEGQIAAQVQDKRSESLELSTPDRQPAVMDVGVQTVVTFKITVADSNIRRPRLQFFDPASGKWHRLHALRDDGKSGDAVAADRTFTLQLLLLADSQGMTTISLQGSSTRVKGHVPSPPQFRLAARKKAFRGIIVSPAFAIPVGQRFAEDQGRYSVDIPAQTESKVADDVLVLNKENSFTGEEDQSLMISVDPNPNNLSVEQYYDGDPGRDLLGQSDGVFTSLTVNGQAAFKFLPTVTFGGENIVVIQRPGFFIVIADNGDGLSESGDFDSLVSTITF